LGDFNVHVDDGSEARSAAFLDILNSFALTQHIQQATHVGGHTLDLVITRDAVIDNISVLPLSVSDHFPLYFNYQLLTPVVREPGIEIQRRNIRDIEIPKFIESLPLSELLDPSAVSPVSVDVLTDRLNSMLASTFDQLAPAHWVAAGKTKTESAPWFTTELVTMQRKKRALEKQTKKPANSCTVAEYRKYVSEYKRKIKLAKASYYATKIKSVRGILNGCIASLITFVTDLKSKKARLIRRLLTLSSRYLWT